jgi:hypothetical protein
MEIHGIDLMCLVSKHCVTTSIHQSMINPVIRSVSKTPYLVELDFGKPLVVSILQKQQRAETLQPGLKLDNLKPLA